MTFTGYAIDLENREELVASSTKCPTYAFGDLPERVDPRKSKLAEEGWLKVENQGSIGSCQGNALTENMEYCYAVATGAVEQFSRMYAYLLSQRFDGISGDRGSTLNGGTKAAKQGVCRESLAPYPRQYPGMSWMTQSMHDDAKNFKLKSHTALKSADECRNYIGAGAGIVQIGIMWGSDMDPDSKGCIRSFSGSSGGGHSVVLCGYIPDSDIGVRSSAGYWFLLKNSWDKRWGVGGYAYWDPTAGVQRAINHRFSSFIGRSDMETPNIRTLPHDFTKKGIRL